ncbi:MAG: hypothetical protein II365_00355 [Clostridia bacterium]|nr:hypothetical protein [Clostridia bacterium]
MVLETKKTTVAYRCPHCGAGIMSAVDVFSLNADMVKLKCTCQKSELTIVKTNDGKIRLVVPCILCPRPHNFVISSSIFFGKDLFVLPCAYSDINICFIGEINHVKAELARSELELLDLLEQSGVDSFEALHGNESVPDLTDPQILDIVMFVIKDLDEEGKILCRCKDGEEKNFDVEVTDDGVRVNCTKCGASRLIPTDSTLAAHAFLNTDSLYLE